MTHVVAVWKEDGDTYEDTVPANWVKGNCLFWPQRLQVRRAFEKCDEPDGSWKKFRLVKIKFRGKHINTITSSCWLLFLFLIFINFSFEELVLSLMLIKLKLIQVFTLRGPSYRNADAFILHNSILFHVFSIMRKRAPLHQEIDLKIWIFL